LKAGYNEAAKPAANEINVRLALHLPKVN
jgi:hypothetical protein